ncbi:MAG TPA: DUF4190 domain-containing protein [Streptosporangiaceae bacterium]
MALRFNPPPGWPLPAGFMPPQEWQPDPSWPPVPPEWQLWIDDGTFGGAYQGVPGMTAPLGPQGGSYPPSPGFQPYQAYSQGGPPTSGGTNGFAIAGFVLGIISAVLLSVIFSIVALVQIRNRPMQRGKGLAIAGLVLSGIWTLVIVVVIAVAASSQAHRSANGTITNTGKVSIFSLQVGDCFQNPPESKAILHLSDVTAVPCTTPHDAQVFAQFNATDANFPGTQALVREATRGCRSRISASLDKSKLTSTMSLHFLFPQAQSWADGRRALTCLVVDSTKDLTTSLLAPGAG